MKYMNKEHKGKKSGKSAKNAGKTDNFCSKNPAYSKLLTKGSFKKR